VANPKAGGAEGYRMSFFYTSHLIPLQVNKSQSSNIVPGSNYKNNMMMIMMMMIIIIIIIILI
jgi:hypothetical protein